MHVHPSPLGFVESKHMWFPWFQSLFGSKCVVIYNNTVTDSGIKNQFMCCQRGEKKYYTWAS